MSLFASLKVEGVVCGNCWKIAYIQQLSRPGHAGLIIGLLFAGAEVIGRQPSKCALVIALLELLAVP